MEEEHNVLVSEEKFNGTSTLEVTAPSKEVANAFARRFFREEYGHSPSRVVVEEKSMYENKWTVMVADHSSGSLKSYKTYEYTENETE